MWRYVKMLALPVWLGTAVLLACLFLLANESKAGGGTLCVALPGEPTGPFAACAAVFTQIQDVVDTAVLVATLRPGFGYVRIGGGLRPLPNCHISELSIAHFQLTITHYYDLSHHIRRQHSQILPHGQGSGACPARRLARN